MLLRKQNLALSFTILFVVGLLGFFIFQSGFFRDQSGELATSAESTTAQAGVLPPQEAISEMGELINNNSEAATNENNAKSVFAEIVTQMTTCLQLKIIPLENQSVSVDFLLNVLQAQMGPATQVDRWRQWHLKTDAGQEKRLRLEIMETDDGTMRKELQMFHISAEGQLSSVEIPQDLALNPTDELINQFLKEGQVFKKERAGAIIFVTGERLEFIELEGKLVDFEFVRNQGTFQCDNLKATSSCRCIK